MANSMIIMKYNPEGFKISPSFQQKAHCAYKSFSIDSQTNSLENNLLVESFSWIRTQISFRTIEDIKEFIISLESKSRRIPQVFHH